MEVPTRRLHPELRPNRLSRRGFSLIEMLIVVVVMGILIAISAGAIGRQIARDRVMRSANVVQALVEEASQLAVRRNTPVNIELSGNSLQIIDRDAASGSDVIKQRSFGPENDLRATITMSPAIGITIFPNGRADAALQVTVAGSGLTQVVSRTTTGIVRRQ